MEVISGATLLDQEVYTDERGDLAAFEQFRTLPFPLARTFVISVKSPNVVRGGHANSCDELIIALTGSVIVEVDNGYQRASVRLCGYKEGIWVKAGVLIRLINFDPPTMLLVCASAPYDETLHFNEPRPDLMMRLVE